MAERLAFVAEWLDPVSGVTWNYQLMFFPETLEVEMFDVKNRRTFLRRCKIEGLQPDLFFIGSKVTIYGRQIDIKNYGDAYTRNLLENTQQRTLAIVKPDAQQHIGKIVSHIYEAGFLISKMRKCRLSQAEACAFYEAHRDKPFFETLTSFMSSGDIIALELVASDAISRWRDAIGPTSSDDARKVAPDSLRAKFGTDGTRNAVHGSDSPESAARESEFFFGPKRAGDCVTSGGTTLGIIKPHAITSKCAGALLDEIASSFDIRSLALFNVDKPAASEFFEVYRGVIAPSEYTGMVDELTSGPSIVLELGPRDGGEPVEPFRQMCGPADPEVARVLRPHSLRARFGVDKNRNAVHCTDLHEDGPLEVNYFFQIMQGA